ncbi:MAG: patatin-like phospholipase family protein [Candidatus Zixiibacteriota bacterium]
MGKTAIVMSGGGAKGAFELGAAHYLIKDKEIDPEVIVGVSTGNLNAAMLAQGKGYVGLVGQLYELENIWFSIDENEDVYYERFGGMVGLLLKADSIYSNKPLWKLIKENVDPFKLKDSGRILRIGVVGLMGGEYYAVSGSYERILDMIRASAAIPVYFNPVDIDTERWVDGGVRNITPLASAFAALAETGESADSTVDDPDTIYVILASPLETKKITDESKLDSGIEILSRSIELLTDEIYRNDLETAMSINEAVKYYHKLKSMHQNLPPGFPFADHRNANIVLIAPEILHMGSLEFDRVKIKKAFEAGKKRAEEALTAAEQADGSNVTPKMLQRTIKVIK